MWIPRRTKYKKIQKNRMNLTFGNRKTTLCKGNLGIVTMKAGILIPSQLQTLYRTLKKSMKKKGKLWFRVFPQHQKTKKALGVRMGKGKGNVDSYYVSLRPYNLICEFRIGRSKTIRLAELAYKCKNKIHLPTALVYRTSKNQTRIFQSKYLLKVGLMELE